MPQANVDARGTLIALCPQQLTRAATTPTGKQTEIVTNFLKSSATPSVFVTQTSCYFEHSRLPSAACHKSASAGHKKVSRFQTDRAWMSYESWSPHVLIAFERGAQSHTKRPQASELLWPGPARLAMARRGTSSLPAALAPAHHHHSLVTRHTEENN